MSMSNKAEEEKRIRSKPPSSIGVSRKSPTTAPSGLVSIKANQKRIVLVVIFPGNKNEVSACLDI